MTIITTTPTPHGRGCGNRKRGKLYACCGTSPLGLPVERFVPDPVIPYPGAWHRGAEIIQVEGIYHLFIFVGVGPYPAAWDYIDETGKFGASRAVSPDLPYHLLAPGESRLVMVHPRAVPTFTYHLDARRGDMPLAHCRHPKEGDGPPAYHVTAQTPCAFALRDLAYHFHPEAEVEDIMCFTVRLPSSGYSGIIPPRPPQPYAFDGYSYRAGVILALPLTHFEGYQRINPDAKAAVQAAGFETIELDW